MENLIKALVKAQAEFPIIQKNRTGQKGNIKHNYADLATIVEHTRPICAKNGLCHTFTIAKYETGADLITTLFHESGEKIESVYPLGNLGGMSDKDAGIRISYAKRYSLKAILAIEESEDPHDNGWGSDGPKRNETPTKQTQSSNIKRNGTNTTKHPNPPPQPRKIENKAPGMSGRVTVGELKVLGKIFKDKEFSNEQATQMIANEFGKKSVDLTKDEFHKACDLVQSLGLSLLDEYREGE